MKQPILSIIVPTRDNTESLEAVFLKSIIINTNNVNNIELVFVVDKDDKKTIDFLSNNQAIKDLTFCQILKRKRSNNITEDYYNYGAKKSYGFFVMPGADDIKIDTPNYDLILLKTKEGIIKTEGPHKKHFFLFKTFGEGNGGRSTGFAGSMTPELREHGSRDQYCFFPILTRDSIDLLGYFLAPSTIPAWGADWFIDKLYKVLNRVAVTVPQINITQVSQHNTSTDVTNKDKQRDERMRIASSSMPKHDENPDNIFEILKAVHCIVTQNLEIYTPSDVWKKYEGYRLIDEATGAQHSGNRCPDIYLKILRSIQQALHENERR